MSAPDSPLCQICSTHPAKYTCPRCSARTCSLPCSRTHKSTTGCSGQRDKAAFVPLKEYGYGKLMDDYVFLEDGKRKAEQWGKEIVGLKMDRDAESSTNGKSGAGKSFALRRALRERGIDVEFLPEGMERRRKNQSHYNQKTHLVQLSMEYKYASSSTSSSPTEPLQTHQMQNIPLNSSSTLHHIYTHQARKIPPHYPTPSDPTDDLVFAMQVYQPSGTPLPAPQHTPPSPSSTPTTTTAQRFYPPFGATTPLETALKGTSFLEFPTIHVFLRPHWDRILQQGQAVVVRLRGGDGSRGLDAGSEGGERAGVDVEMPRKKARMEQGDGRSVEETPTAGGSVQRNRVPEGPPVGASVDPVTQPRPEQENQDGRQMQQVATAGLALDYGTESEEGG